MTTMTLLRNEAYLGGASFRGKVFPGTHAPLIDEELIQAAQTMMDERGENYSKRRSNASDYLLGGLMTCAHCGSKFIGTAARGNRYQYRYYTWKPWSATSSPSRPARWTSEPARRGSSA